jgi:hypothetical protein
LTTTRAELTPLTDAQWEQRVRARLMVCVPDLLPGTPTVRRITGLADDVWLVDLADGGRLVAKHQFYGIYTRDEPHDLLRVEFDALRHLRQHGGAVPVAFGIDPEMQIILLEYAGRLTLAEQIPSVDPSTRRRLGARVLAGLFRIESLLAAPELEWGARVIPGADPGDLMTRWAEIGEIAVDGLSRLWRARRRDEMTAGLATQLKHLCRRLGERPPSLGATDYQPANIVVDEPCERITFLELAKVGWDWTERRAVQYTTSVDGSGTSLLDSGGVAASPLASDAVDGHHILFLLLLARRFLTTSHGDMSGLVQALVTPLSRDPRALEIRRGLQPLNFA